MSEKDYLTEALEHWKGLAEFVRDSSRLPPIGTIDTLVFQGKRVVETLSVGALDKTDDAWTLELMDPVRRLDNCLNPTNIPWGYRERKTAIVERWPAGTLRAITRLRRALDGVMEAMGWSGDETADGMPRFPKMVDSQGKITEEWITATDKADHPTAESFAEQFRVNTRTLQAEMEWIIEQERLKAGAGPSDNDPSNPDTPTQIKLVESEAGRPQIQRPPEKAFKAWRLRDALEINDQTTIAQKLSEKGIPATQGQVSRWLKQVQEYLAAGNILPPLPKMSKSTSMDPAAINMGKRVDRRTPRPSDMRDDS